MALINNNYVLAKNESVTYESNSTSHPIEEGIDITDHVQRKPISLSISGVISDTSNKKSAEIIESIKNLQISGSLIKYIGRISLGNMQIQSFNTDYEYKNWGGCTFDMELKEVRIAKSAYDAAKSTALTKKQTSSQQVSQGDISKVYHTVKKGDCVWNLVTKQYKDLKPTYSKTMDKCNWVMNQNPDAFSRKGDFGTLKIGAKLYVGHR